MFIVFTCYCSDSIENRFVLLIPFGPVGDSAATQAQKIRCPSRGKKMRENQLALDPRAWQQNMAPLDKCRFRS